MPHEPCDTDTVQPTPWLVLTMQALEALAGSVAEAVPGLLTAAPPIPSHGCRLAAALLLLSPAFGPALCAVCLCLK